MMGDSETSRALFCSSVSADALVGDASEETPLPNTSVLAFVRVVFIAKTIDSIIKFELGQHWDTNQYTGDAPFTIGNAGLASRFTGRARRGGRPAVTIVIKLRRRLRLNPINFCNALIQCNCGCT